MKNKVLSFVLVLTLLVSLSSFTVVYSYDSWTVEETLDYLYNDGDFAGAPVPLVAKGIDALYYVYEAAEATTPYIFSDPNFARKEGNIENLTHEEVVSYFEDVKTLIQAADKKTTVDSENVFDVTVQALADAFDLAGNQKFAAELRKLFVNAANVFTELTALKNVPEYYDEYIDLVFGDPDIWDLKSKSKPVYSGGSSSSVGSSSGSSRPSRLPGAFTGDVVVALYDDVSESHWSYEYVRKLSEAGIINGVGNRKFDPNATLTRAAVVKMLACLVDAELVSKDVSFTDVPVSAWHNPYVAWGLENGIINGYSDTVFAPDKDVSREELSAIVVRFMTKFNVDYAAADESALFADHDNIEPYAVEAVYVMKNNGIVSGKGDNMFYPQDTSTRAEAAKVISMVSDLLKK